MKKNLYFAATTLVLSAMAAPAFAGHICWVDKVVQSPDGLELFMAAKGPAHVSVQRSGSKDVKWVADNPLAVREGDKVYAYGAPGDACSITAKTDADRLGGACGSTCASSGRAAGR